MYVYVAIGPFIWLYLWVIVSRVDGLYESGIVDILCDCELPKFANSREMLSSCVVM